MDILFIFKESLINPRFLSWISTEQSYFAELKGSSASTQRQMAAQQDLWEGGRHSPMVNSSLI